MATTDFKRNNLDAATSPYLLQHKHNPVWWQEWSESVLDYARTNDKPLFVSVGYATCHWCHVMAEDTFSDPECAAYLNAHFVSVKVDREQRPDIDQFMMAFLVATQGSGGWPLNVFLSPELSPFFATTYLGAKPRFGRPGFHSVLEQIRDFYDENRDRLRENSVSLPAESGAEDRSVDDPALASTAAAIRSALDQDHGGFGSSQKFPPHATLLYCLYDVAASDRTSGREVVTTTLDAMAQRGLHDHLQGGFFRYCVDGAWTIPHFEKMLYDQAMLLWSYALAADVLGRPDYARVAEGIVTCLEETFRTGDAYVSAHDADTDHEEGATYLFTVDQLESILSPDELSLFREGFDIAPEGNFEGKTHLVRTKPFSSDTASLGISAKLLRHRRLRAQPAVDTKVVTSWNALAGIALVEAGRRLGNPSLIARAEEVEAFLIATHYSEGRLAHSSNEGRLQNEEFLEDVAAFFLFETYLLEERQFRDGDDTRRRCEALARRLEEYSDGDTWFEARNEDFMPVPAQGFDSPTPAAISLAVLAKTRWAQLSGAMPDELPLRPPLSHDFYNVAALWASGYVHEVHCPSALAYDRLPVHSVQIRDESIQDCYRGVCRRELPDRLG